jgi:hypothetical protein
LIKDKVENGEVVRVLGAETEFFDERRLVAR